MPQLMIHLEDDLMHQLEDAAGRIGLPLDDYVVERLKQDMDASMPAREGEDSEVEESAGDLILRIFSEVSEEEWETLPTDLSENHDHYIYGVPKRTGAQ